MLISVIFVFSVKWAEINGTTYKFGAIVVINSDLMPEFGKIVDILIIHQDSSCLFVCETFFTDCFNAHYHGYEVIPSKEITIIKQSNLIDHHVLHDYKINFSHSLIPLKYHILERFL